MTSREEMAGGEPQPGQEEDRSTSKLTWVVPVAVIAVLVLLYFVIPSFRSFFDEAWDVMSSGDQQRIRSWVEQFGAWGVVVVVGLMMLQTVAAFLPSLATMVVAVLAYGPFLGGLIAWGGMLVAATLGYGIGAALGPAIIGSLISRATEQKLEEYVARYGGPGIVAARISPALSTDAVSIVAGLVDMRYVKFITATAIGTAPLAVLVAWLGADVSRLGPGLVVVSVVSLLLFVAYVIWDHRRSDDD